ncbi:MAG: response regulator transcription factor [Anaerolineae bacterium]
MATILVVDDEKNIVKLAKLYLESEGYRVECAYDGVTALQRIRAEQPSLIILDLMLPELDGFEVCRRVRQQSDIPILMLTARSDDVDKIVGLELGADDYLTKPFNPRELVARVKAILRRYEASRSTTRLEVGDLVVDLDRREVTVADKPVGLRPKEFELLATLVRNRGLVLSRERLLELVWGYDYMGETRTVDVHVARLRDKLADSLVAIETVWGVGYKLIETS